MISILTIYAYAIYAASVAAESSVREPRDHHVVAVLLLDEPSFSAFAVTWNSSRVKQESPYREVVRSRRAAAEHVYSPTKAARCFSMLLEYHIPESTTHLLKKGVSSFHLGLIPFRLCTPVPVRLKLESDDVWRCVIGSFDFLCLFQ